MACKDVQNPGGTTFPQASQNTMVAVWKFPKAQYVEVSKYQLKDGEKWVAYDYCKNCGWEPGDHKDTDLCEECAAGK